MPACGAQCKCAPSLCISLCLPLSLELSWLGGKRQWMAPCWHFSSVHSLGTICPWALLRVPLPGAGSARPRPSVPGVAQIIMAPLYQHIHLLAPLGVPVPFSRAPQASCCPGPGDEGTCPTTPTPQRPCPAWGHSHPPVPELTPALCPVVAMYLVSRDCAAHTLTNAEGPGCAELSWRSWGCCQLPRP